jgi:hypothetical protein
MDAATMVLIEANTRIPLDLVILITQAQGKARGQEEQVQGEGKYRLWNFSILFRFPKDLKMKDCCLNTPFYFSLPVWLSQQLPL